MWRARSHETVADGVPSVRIPLRPEAPGSSGLGWGVLSDGLQPR